MTGKGEPMPKPGWKWDDETRARQEANYGSPLERFWRHIEPDTNGGCWLWSGTLLDVGYGQFSVNRAKTSAHRFSWESLRGPIPSGMFICHRCDVRACVNPDHLFLGTQADNMRDAAHKGRVSRGDNHLNAVVNETIVREIRALAEAGQKPAQIAKTYGLKRTTVGAIVRRRAWAHVQ